jgi:hypothetical protein
VDDPRLHVIRTGHDGELDGTTEADVREMFARLRREPKVVVHFHGGLVDQESGRRIADDLTGVYREAGAYPVFFVWSSGVGEILRGNLREILVEPIFQRIRSWAVRLVLAKIGPDDARAGEGLPVPGDRAVHLAMRALDRGEEPYAGVTPAGAVAELTPAERVWVERQVAADPLLEADLVAATPASDTEEGSRGVGGVPGGLRPTRMDPEVLAELRAPEGARGLISMAAVGKKVAQIVIAVLRRYRAGTDHDVYCTVVEEVLRALYLADLGGALWQAIKQETEDTFRPASPPRGGALFLDGLEELLAEGVHPQVTLVGHSTGAIFIENLVTELRRRRADPATAIPADFRFANIVYLAPASRFPHSWELMEHWPEVAGNFRLFAMTDEAERADQVAPGYPRSLLYLVSGVAERDQDRSAWVPIVGQARYYVDALGAPLAADSFEALAGVRDLRTFVLAGVEPVRTVWSPTPADAPPGFRAGARRHGDFDDDPLVHESLQYLIRNS